MKKQEKSNWTFLATVYPLGYFPVAPGTIGSIPGLLLGVMIWEIVRIFGVSGFISNFISIGILALFGLLSYVAIAKTEDTWKCHDDKKIVIDEVVGQALVVMFFPPTLLNFLLSFIFFRLFDIWKPWPIGFIDRKWQSSFATLLDDVLAGVFAIVPLYLYMWLSSL